MIGHGREQAISDLIRQFVPRRLEVLSGAIVPGNPVSKAARQIDGMVADTLQYPSVLRVGEVAILLPDSVRAAIEVKSNLRKPPDGEKLLKALSSDADEGDAVPDDTDEDTDEDGDAADAPDGQEGAPGDINDANTADRAEDAGDAAQRVAKNTDATAKKKQKKKMARAPLAETFFDAMVQVGRLQELFDSGAAVFTALVSYWTPKKVQKLREYLDQTIKLREACRTAALASVEKRKAERTRLGTVTSTPSRHDRCRRRTDRDQDPGLKRISILSAHRRRACSVGPPTKHHHARQRRRFSEHLAYALGLPRSRLPERARVRLRHRVLSTRRHSSPAPRGPRRHAK